MPRKKKSKYTARADGTYYTKRTYNGKQKFFYGKTDEEIDRKIALFERGEWKKSQVRTVDEVADDYWQIKERELSPNTVQSYLTAINRIKNEFEEIPVNKLTVQEIYDFLYRFKMQNYSTKVISNTRCILKGILDNAIIKGEIKRNPCKDLPPILGQPKVKRTSASDEDVVKIVEHRNDSMVSRMHFFALVTGLRRGELTALRFGDINLEKRELYVRRSCAWDSGMPVIKEPKTQAGIRTVSLVDDAIDVLPPFKSSDSYVFYDKLPTTGSQEGAFNTFRKHLGIKSTLHQLRHSYASMMHSAGIEAFDAQHELGHANIAMTLDVYTDFEDRKRKEVREKMNDFITKNLHK